MEGQLRGSWFFIFLVVSSCLISCRSKSNPEAETTHIDSTNATIDSGPNLAAVDLNHYDLARIDSAFTSRTIVDTNDALNITGALAISIVPDSLHMAQQIKADSEGFNSMADDYSYYTSMARDTLLRHGITSDSYSHGKRYIIFRGKTGVICTFDGNKMPDSWGTILFNGKDTPVLWNGTDISSTVPLVFKR